MTNSHSDIQLTEDLYKELKACAQRILSQQSGKLTMQATEVVHEACIKLMGTKGGYENKAHVYRCAAKAMRHLLIDYVRAKSAKKRGQKILQTIALDDLLSDTDTNLGLITIDQTLNEMGSISERLETISELYYFSGFAQTEIADIMSVSIATVERELKFARAFLNEKLQTSE